MLYLQMKHQNKLLVYEKTFHFLFPVFASAQLQDDFSDGDFTANPTWSGDVTSFQVLSGQLNSTNQVTNATFYLSTPSTLASAAQWEIYMKLDFSTSSLNYVDVYLTSDAADLNAVGGGYFVRVGGTADEICLYRNDLWDQVSKS